MAVIEITNENFEEKVLNEKKPVLLDFFAVWCGPCQMLSPTVDEIGEEKDDIVVGKINVDDQPELANAFGVSSIPTLVVMKDGKEAARAVGFRSKEQVLALL